MSSNNKRVWDVNCKLLYDVYLSYSLEWPSLTVDWLPGCEDLRVEEKDVERRRLLLATHTSGRASENLIVAELLIPIEPDVVDNASKACKSIIFFNAYLLYVLNLNILFLNMNLYCRGPLSNFL